MEKVSKQIPLSESFMACFARQANDNTVTGVDVESFVQALLLFDRCIVASIWLKDIQILLRMVDAQDLSELIAAGTLSFYIDSATAAETGQVRRTLNLTGNSTHLADNEFSFSTIKGRDDEFNVKKSLFELSSAIRERQHDSARVASAVETALHRPSGLELYRQSFEGLHSDLRSPVSTALRDLMVERMRVLGVSHPERLELRIEEFVKEDFRFVSNLSSTFGFSAREARKISLKAVFDLNSVHIRLAHMRHFNTLIGMNSSEEAAWQIKADTLMKGFVHEGQRERQFTRVVKIAGLGERRFVNANRIDLGRLIEVRNSEELIAFRAWLKSTDAKTDSEIKDRVTSLRGRIGNAAQSPLGKVIRVLVSSVSNLIQNPVASKFAGTVTGLADAFLVDRYLKKDTIQAIVGNEYPAIFQQSQ